MDIGPIAGIHGPNLAQATRPKESAPAAPRVTAPASADDEYDSGGGQQENARTRNNSLLPDDELEQESPTGWTAAPYEPSGKAGQSSNSRISYFV